MQRATRKIFCFFIFYFSWISPLWAQSLSDLDALRYIASHPDLIQSLGSDPSKGRNHYDIYAVREGRRITFDPNSYMASYPDLIIAFGGSEERATRHFIDWGFKEGRSSGSFDGLAYVASYPDLIAVFGLNAQRATRHYIEWGYREGRRVSFDPLAYIASYADLIRAFAIDTIQATRHYIEYGFNEGRKIIFDVAAYLSRYADLRAAFGDNNAAATRHYIQYGFVEGRVGTVPVSQGELQFPSSTVTFTGQGVGTRSAAKTVELRNIGTATLEIRRIGLSGSGASSFSLSGSCSSVAVGQACRVGLAFLPSSQLSKSASLVIEHSGSAGRSTIAISGQPAPINWVQGPRGHYYAFVPAPDGVTWSEADLATRLISPPIAGMSVNLVSITDSVESDLVWSILPGSLFWRNPRGCACWEWGPWIGGVQASSMPNYSEPFGGWRWSDGEALRFSNWAAGEPNNANGGEDFVHLVRVASSRAWNDLPNNPLQSSDPGPVLGFVIEAEVLPRAGWTAAATGHYYRYVSVPSGISWNAARDAAVVFGAPGSGFTTHLATVTSDAEAKVIADMLPEEAFKQGNIGGGFWGPWIGAYQDRTASDYSEPRGGWRWVTGEPWGTPRWSNGEPNNSYAGAAEDYAHLFYQTSSGHSKSSGLWNDMVNNPQNEIAGYVLEATPSQ